MIENLDQAKEELKRADHLFYVSLKYTRTVDVFKSLVDRLINLYDFCMQSLLLKLEKDKKIDTIPSAPITKAMQLKKAYADDEEIVKTIDTYLLLRKISKIEDFQRHREFRRHVTMSFTLDGVPMELNIDRMQELFDEAKAFVMKVASIVEND